MAIHMRYGLWAVLILGLLGSLGCAKKTASEGGAAKAPAVVSEGDLPLVRLSEKEALSQEIKTEPVRTVPVQQTLALHGWITVPPGRELTLTAQVAGHVLAPSSERNFPVPGKPITANTELLRLKPVLSPLEQAQFQAAMIQLQTVRRGVEGELAKARESVQAATKERNRVSELVASKLRGDQDLEQAQARLRHAEEDLNAAKDKLRLFEDSVSGLEKDLTRPISVTTPRDGRALAVLVSPGQYVTAGSPLVTLADLSTLWVRVAVPENDLARVQSGAEAAVVVGGQRLAARPVALVPRVDPLRHTADWNYELNGDKPLPPLAREQMVTVHVPVSEKKDETIVPPSALYYDAFGGAWVYLELEPKDGLRRYQRHRVEPGPRVAEGVVVWPKLGAPRGLVVEGAAALYSLEFHIKK